MNKLKHWILNIWKKIKENNKGQFANSLSLS